MREVGHENMSDRMNTTWLATPVAHWCIVTAVTAAGAAWLHHTGPVPAIRITTPLAENAPFWYMLSPFPILGMLIAELIGTLSTAGVRRCSVELAFSIAVLVVVSHFRLSLRLPLSGHSFLLSYFILRRAFLKDLKIPSLKTEMWIGVIMFVVMLYPKLVWWTDPITLCAGMIAGALLFGCSRLAYGGRNNQIETETAQPKDRQRSSEAAPSASPDEPSA